MRVKRMILCLILGFFVFPRINFAEDNEEIKFGFYTDRAFLSIHTVVFNESLNKRISEIGNRIAKASDRPVIKYTFRVINNPVVNAYSASGGFIYINTGVLDILESEDEVAAILAHEIAHTNKDHQVNFWYSVDRKETQAKIASYLIIAAALAANIWAQGSMTGLPSHDRSLKLVSLVGHMGSLIGPRLVGVMTVSMIKGYGKEQEEEADALAVQYTKKAGYDPNALISVFKKLISIRNRLGINERNYVSSLINAEPGLEERIKQAEELILNPNKIKQSKEK